MKYSGEFWLYLNSQYPVSLDIYFPDTQLGETRRLGSSHGDMSGNDGCSFGAAPLMRKHIPPLPQLILPPTDYKIHVQVGSWIIIYTWVGNHATKMAEQQGRRHLDP